MKDKVVVFGGSGFLGSHVADILSLKKYSVTIFDNHESQYLKSDQKFVKGDILSIDEVMKVTKGAKYVYNFAGLSDLNSSKNYPIESVNLNILGNLNILESCRKNNVKLFIFASTIYVYSNKGSFYRVSKQAAENYIENYGLEFGQKYAILRYGSLYGSRSDKKNGLFNFIYSALNNKKLEFEGSSLSKREFINVEDAAECTVNILKSKKIDKFVTITGNQSITINELFNLIKEILPNKKIVSKFNNNKNDHYSLTPYEYNPKYGKKIIPEKFIDLGQGILSLIGDIDRDLINKKD